MADVRTLKLNLLADVDQFGRSLAQADNDAKGFAGGLKKYGKIAAAAFVVAGAAAAAYAVKIGIDGVKAAVEDEASQKQLAQALKNIGVADTKLRPALANLARATGDVGKAQQLTNLAMDISAATGKDLETVSLTLSKAYNGNIGALTKLGIPLDENIKKTKDFNVVQDELVRLFGGAAKANTETYAGQLAIVTERVGELKESIGVALLPTMKTLLEEVNKVAKGFSGEDPEGLSNRARELAGNFEGDGAFSLGGALRAVADAFGNLFSTVTDGGPGAASMMERIAASLETVANAINAISNAYQAALPALRFIQNPLNINLPEAGFTPRPKARAAGGSVMGGQAYRVGEFGPELFVPSGSGSVRPDAGGGQNVTINMNGIIDGESARRSIEKLLQDSARRTGAVNFVGATL